MDRISERVLQRRAYPVLNGGPSGRPPFQNGRAIVVIRTGRGGRVDGLDELGDCYSIGI